MTIFCAGCTCQPTRLRSAAAPRTTDLTSRPGWRRISDASPSALTNEPLLVTNTGTETARQRPGRGVCVRGGQHGRVIAQGLDDRERAGVLAPDGFERGNVRLAAQRCKQRELPAIEPGAVSCRGDQRSRGDPGNGCGQSARDA